MRPAVRKRTIVCLFLSVLTHARLQCNFATMFVATHKSACVATRFSGDGQFLATASTDCSIKVVILCLFVCRCHRIARV